MTQPEHNRRATDARTLDIESMIAAEDDSKQRAFLIVLNSINNSLVANTSTIRDISEKLETHLTNFDTHTQNEEATLNKGRGAWRVIAAVLAQLQAVNLPVNVKQINGALIKGAGVEGDSWGPV